VEEVLCRDLFPLRLGKPLDGRDDHHHHPQHGGPDNEQAEEQGHHLPFLGVVEGCVVGGVILTKEPHGSPVI